MLFRADGRYLHATFQQIAAHCNHHQFSVAARAARVLDDLRREIAVFETGRGQFGYEMFVLERV